MPPCGIDERFVRDEGLNINIRLLIIIKYIIIIITVFPRYKLKVMVQKSVLVSGRPDGVLKIAR